MLIGSRDIVYSSLRNFNYNFSYLYVRMGKILRLDHILFGAKPAMIQILVLVSYRLGKRALESWAIGLIGLFLFIINLAYVILGSCLLGLLLVQI